MGYYPQGGVLTSSRAGASWAPNRLDVFVRAATTRFTGDSWTLGCDYVQQHVELQPLICSALLYRLDPVVGGLCMHILGLSLEEGVGWAHVQPINRRLLIYRGFPRRHRDGSLDLLNLYGGPTPLA